MELVIDQSSTQASAADLASVRSYLLYVAESSDSIDARLTSERISRLKTTRPDLSGLLEDCEKSIRAIGCNTRSADIHDALDKLAKVEAALFDIPLPADEAASFVDASFVNIVNKFDRSTETVDIDQETLVIFRGEATELLQNIDAALKKLEAD